MTSIEKDCKSRQRLSVQNKQKQRYMDFGNLFKANDKYNDIALREC